MPHDRSGLHRRGAPERGNAYVAQEYECQFKEAGATRIEDCVPVGMKMALGIDPAISEKETADYMPEPHWAGIGRQLARPRCASHSGVVLPAD